MRCSVALATIVYTSVCCAALVLINTTSGLLQGSEVDGLLMFKGIVNLISPEFDQTETKVLLSGLVNLQREHYAGKHLFHSLPLPAKLQRVWAPHACKSQIIISNVWAPVHKTEKRAVLVWIYGGAFVFGTGSLPLYDGVSIATNQDIVVVSFNYRTNVFGFPGSPDLPLAGNNLGFLDQGGWVFTLAQYSSNKY
ncbi:Carboxylesterase family-domain-containing protein [Mycena latifolia]|nr:Carboxylesterase family-domain-containing protein [Mycena latifolia]